MARVLDLAARWLKAALISGVSTIDKLPVYVDLGGTSSVIQLEQDGGLSIHEILLTIDE